MPLSGGRHGLGPKDRAVLADQHRGPIRDALVVEPHTVGFGDSTLGMEVGEQRELDPVETLRPRLVAELRIDTQTQNLGLGRVELLEKSVQTRNLDASGGREIQRI